jgi:hypothetical protein
MKRIVASLTIITLMSIASVSYADKYYKKGRHSRGSGYNAPVIIKIFLGHDRRAPVWSGSYSKRHSPEYRYVGHRPRNKSYGYRKFRWKRFDAPYREFRRHRFDW